VSQKANTNTGQKQTFISAIILGCLAVIAGGIFLVQFKFSPAVQPVASVLAVDNQNQAAPLDSTGKALITFPNGQAPLGPLETFDASGLSDKINGKAELYLTAGFIRLLSQRFEDKTAGDVWMEVFVYDMQSTQNAFAVFSAQRREDAQPVNIRQYAYQTQNALFLVHGSFYVEIIASEVSETIRQSMRSFAEAFIAQHPIEATPAIAEKQIFPEEGLVADSIALISADAFGYDRFDQIFTATYRLKDAELMAYISSRKTPREAEALAFGYQEFLTTFGGETAEFDSPIASAKMIYILDTYEIVFAHGTCLAGVREAEDKQTARELAMRLFKRIKEADPKSESDVK
jgi:hypothetical protein